MAGADLAGIDASIQCRYDSGSMLRRLQTKDVGPVQEMDLTLGSRLNVLTGDNGLGKSFVLDLVWYVLTGSWVGEPALPSGGSPWLKYEGTSNTPQEKEKATAEFKFESQTWSWKSVQGRGPRGSVIYLGADRMAAFVLHRSHWPTSPGADDARRNEPGAFVFRGTRAMGR